MVAAPWQAAELTPKAPPTDDKPFRADLLKVAADYKSWGRVDDEMRLVTGTLPVANPGRAYVSVSKDESTHGKKLYSLLTKQRADYLKLDKEKSVPVGFAIVKQSWLPEEITDPKQIPAKGIDRTKVIHTNGPKTPPKDDVFATFGDHFYPYAVKDGKCFKATKQADLFIMLKLDPKTPNTDDGWVYGTVTPDGRTVMAAGKIDSCIKMPPRG